MCSSDLVLDKARQMEDEGQHIIKLNIGNLAPFGFDTPDEVRHDVIVNLPQASGYSDSKGLFAARKAIMSTHADRVATIRDVATRFGVVVDPHTADGIKVGRAHQDAAVPLVCIETALPAKFAATIREALGRNPERPAAYADLEARPQRCLRLPADAPRVKAFIAAHA